MYMYYRFFIHSFTDGYLVCFYFLAIVNIAAKNVRLWIFFQITVLGFFRCIPRSRIAGLKAVPFLIFWGISILLSTVAASVCIPTNNALGFHFLHILDSTCLIYWWWPFWLVWGGIVVLICIFLIISYVEHFFLIYLLCYYSCPISTPSLNSILSTPFLPPFSPIVHVHGSYL